MIKLKLNKDKLISFARVVDDISKKLKAKISLMPVDILKAEANAHLANLKDLSKRIRSKLVMLEDEPGPKRLTYSVNEMQAFAVMKYEGLYEHDPYQKATIQEISVPIYKILLN